MNEQIKQLNFENEALRKSQRDSYSSGGQSAQQEQLTRKIR